MALKGNTAKLQNLLSVVNSLPDQNGQTGTVEPIPSYVKAEARRVLNAVANAQNTNTITFLAMSDSHQLTGDADITNGNHHAGLGAKILAQTLDLDFAAFLGDYTAGSGTTTMEDGRAEIRQMNDWISEAFANIPNFRTVGNHDALLYSHSQNSDYLKPSQLYELIGKYNEGATVDSTNPQRGYCCRDFADKQLRVICLNTADGEESGTVTTEWKERISGPQMLWFAEAMDLSAKSNPANWKIIVFSHHPLDWGVVHPATKVIDAYVNGKNLSFTHNGTAISKDYSGKNAAKFIGNFHGHVHGFRTDNLHLIVNSVGEKIDNALKIATPNSCFRRNNEYGENGKTEYYGIEYGEETTWPKTAGTGQDTAFCVYVIDTVKETINAIHYGAGYDRIIGYGEIPPVVYSITYSLTHVASSNSAAEIAEGNAYTAALTALAGYELESVTITMGGVDITSAAYSSGMVNIGEVTGDIVITAVAEEIPVSYTNLLPLAVDTSGAVYNGIGYKDGVYCSSNGPGEYSTDAGYWSSGLIPYLVPASGKPKDIYIRGWTWESASHCRFQLVRSDKSSLVLQTIGSGSDNQAITKYFSIEALDADAKYYKLTPLMNTENTSVFVATSANTQHTGFFRLSMPGSGAGVVITADEPIE